VRLPNRKWRRSPCAAADVEKSQFALIASGVEASATRHGRIGVGTLPSAPTIRSPRRLCEPAHGETVSDIPGDAWELCCPVGDARGDTGERIGHASLPARPKPRNIWPRAADGISRLSNLVVRVYIGHAPLGTLPGRFVRLRPGDMLLPKSLREKAMKDLIKQYLDRGISRRQLMSGLTALGISTVDALSTERHLHGNPVVLGSNGIMIIQVDRLRGECWSCRRAAHRRPRSVTNDRIGSPRHAPAPRQRRPPGQFDDGLPITRLSD
jgi:hypothetical protein